MQTRKKVFRTKKNSQESEPEEKLEISDDMLDSLENEVQKLDQVQSLDQKMLLHKQLGQKTKNMIDEVDRLISVMQAADRNGHDKKDSSVSDKLDQLDESGDSQITPDKIAKIMSEIESGSQNIAMIEQLGNRIAAYEQIIKKIAICKEYYGKGQLNMRNIN